VLVVCGSADPVVPVSHARALHEGIAGSELVIVEGGGHVPVGQQDLGLTGAVRRFVVHSGASPGAPAAR
jgi:pimeloyl-ACP methyl ester carboxylesterase